MLLTRHLNIISDALVKRRRHNKKIILACCDCIIELNRATTSITIRKKTLNTRLFIAKWLIHFFVIEEAWSWARWLGHRLFALFVSFLIHFKHNYSVEKRDDWYALLYYIEESEDEQSIREQKKRKRNAHYVNKQRYLIFLFYIIFYSFFFLFFLYLISYLDLKLKSNITLKKKAIKKIRSKK
jgi:hypothetical protein